VVNVDVNRDDNGPGDNNDPGNDDGPGDGDITGAGDDSVLSIGYRIVNDSLVLPAYAEDTEVSVLDMKGRIMEVWRSGSSDLSIDLSKLERGIYIVLTQTGSTMQSDKIFLP